MVPVSTGGADTCEEKKKKKHLRQRRRESSRTNREFGYSLKRLVTTGAWSFPPGWRLSILGFDGVKKRRVVWGDVRNLGMSSSRSLLLLSH